MSQRERLMDRWAGPGCLAVGFLGAFLLGRGLELAWPVGATLTNTWKSFACGFEEPDAAQALKLFAAESRWVAAVVLVGLVATICAICSMIALARTGRESMLWRSWPFFVLCALGVLGLLVDIRGIWEVRTSEVPRMYMSRLLLSLPCECQPVREGVCWARIVGEPAGFALGVAMTACASFCAAPSARDLARRLQRLKELLYLAALLFVVGILMSRMNASLVLAHWLVDNNEKVVLALHDVIEADGLQAGVGYSALLSAMFLPARAWLGYRINANIPELERSKPSTRSAWLAELGVSDRWQDDARQILALLAPVLSAPVFEVIARS